MTPQELKSSILQLAIQGKLVEQRPEEGTGEELYRQIQEEKRKLIREGKIKKEKPLPEIAEDEVPFEILVSWKWVRVGRIATKVTDGTHKTPKYTETGIQFVSAKDVVTGELVFDRCRHISLEEHRLLFARCNPEYGDLLISKSGSIGTVVCVNVYNEFSLFESLALVKFNQSLLFMKYLRCAIQNAFTYLKEENIRGVAVKHLPIDSITTMKIPLPPLAEQKRIVARLEEILPLCERLK